MSARSDKNRRGTVERDVAELLIQLNRIKDPELRATVIQFIIDASRSVKAAEGDDDDGGNDHRLN